MAEDRNKLAASLAKNLLETIKNAAELTEKGGADAAVSSGRLFVLAKYNQQAVESFQAALMQNPDHDEAEALLVVSLVQAGDADRAIKHASRLAARNPSFMLKEMSSGQVANAYTLLGDAYASGGNVEEAKSAYEMALEFKDDFVGVRLAQTSLVLGDTKAATQFAEATATNPRFDDFANVLALGQRNPDLLPSLDASQFASLVAGNMVGRPYIVDGSIKTAELDDNNEDWCDTTVLSRRQA